MRSTANVLETNALGFEKVLDSLFERVGIVLGHTKERVALVNTVILNRLPQLVLIAL